MAMFKSRKYLVALGIAVAAFVATFYLAYAGVVQWSREQPATATLVEAVALSDTAVTLYTDSALTQELTPGGVIHLRGIKFLPPLDRFLGSSASFGPIYGKNNSAVPLTPIGMCCPNIIDVESKTILGRWSIGTYCCGPLNPGEARALFQVSALDLQPAAIGLQFSVVLAATGETVDGMGSLSVQLEQALKDAANPNK